MARNKLKFILGAAILADLAMTAAVFVKTCLPTPEELNDAKVENAWRDLEEEYDVPIGFDDPPYDPILDEDEDDKGESNPEFDRLFDEVMSRPTPEHVKRDPIDEGIDNILRYEVNGMTGFERE
jgi:hypothetical protein